MASPNYMVERSEGLKVAALQRRNRGGNGVRLVKLTAYGPDTRSPAQVHRDRIDVLATTAVIIALEEFVYQANSGSTLLNTF